MTIAHRDDANLLKLIKVAKVTVHDRQRHLADLETAKEAASAAHDWLAQSIRTEEEKFQSVSGGDVVSLAAFRNGTADKRKALEATMTTLLVEIEEARDEVRDAVIEAKKLEHLLEIQQRAARREAAKNEAADIDDVALRMSR